MAVAVVLVRGVNVGGHRRVTMADLREALRTAGYPDAATYLQSGNVVLDAGGDRPATVARTVEAALRDELGLDVDVIVRPRAALGRVVATNPFLRRRVDESTLHCAFLSSRPTAAGLRALAAVRAGADEHQVRGTEVYLRYPNGTGRATLTPAAIERALHTPMTVRKWGVVTALLDLAAAHRPG